jgi:hypothetical protein
MGTHAFAERVRASPAAIGRLRRAREGAPKIVDSSAHRSVPNYPLSVLSRRLAGWEGRPRTRPAPLPRVMDVIGWNTHPFWMMDLVVVLLRRAIVIGV